MAKLKFVATWDPAEISTPRGFLPLKYKPFYRKQVAAFLKTLNAKQLKAQEDPEKDPLRDLEVTIEVYYQKRNLDQNALMWSLYEIEANEQNGGMHGSKSQMVTAAELYAADIEEFAEVDIIETAMANYYSYRHEYSLIKSVEWNDRQYSLEELKTISIPLEATVRIHAVRTSSHFNTVQMAEWIDRQFNRLAEMGVSFNKTSEIKDYWAKWQQHKNDEQLEVQDRIMSKDEYRESHYSCEACGEPGIHLAHIKAVGMGFDRCKEANVNYPSNWLILCHKCHIGIQHQKGWSEFLKLYPWLSHKVNSALKREYKPIIVNELSEDLEIF